MFRVLFDYLPIIHEDLGKHIFVLQLLELLLSRLLHTQSLPLDFELLVGVELIKFILFFHPVDAVLISEVELIYRWYFHLKVHKVGSIPQEIGLFLQTELLRLELHWLGLGNGLGLHRNS